MQIKRELKEIALPILLLSVLRNMISPEIHFLICVVYIFYLLITTKLFNNFRLKWIGRYSYIYILIFMALIGISVGVLHINQYSVAAIARDIYYLAQPIIFISLGICYYYKYNEKNILKTFVASALLMNLYYTFDIITNLGAINLSNVNAFREIVGKEYIISTLGLYFLICCPSICKNKKMKILLITFFSIIFLLQFSRACLGMLVISLLAYMFYTKKKLSIKGLKKILLAILVIIVVIQLIPRSLLTNYIDKILHSTAEVSTSHTFNSYEAISQNYRGYETMRALDTYSNGNAFNWLLGFGFGKYVELNYFIDLGGEIMTRVPTFHNGYMYLLIKFGIIGIIFYLLFFYKNISRYRKQYIITQKNEWAVMIGLLLGALIFAYFKGGIIRTDGLFEIPFLIGFYTNHNARVKKADICLNR